MAFSTCDDTCDTPAASPAGSGRSMLLSCAMTAPVGVCDWTIAPVAFA